MWRPPDIRFTGGFFLLWGWFAFSCGVRAAWLVLMAALIHETGHLLALGSCRVRVRRLHLGILGAVMETTGTMGYGQEFLAALAGPGANLLAALFLSRRGLSAAAGANLVLGLFNLLPIYPLDGGQALETALCALTGPCGAVWARRWIGGPAAGIAVTAGALLMIASRGSLWLLPALAGLLRLFLRGIWGDGSTGPKAWSRRTL